MKNNIADQISDLVTIPDILEKYGYNISRNRRIPCPIHNGKDPNFCYTDSVFHCWTCGEKGNAISLVSKLFNLSFSQTLIKINNDFQLGLTNKKPTHRQRIQEREASKKRKEEKVSRLHDREVYLFLCQCHARLMRVVGEEKIIWLDDFLDENIDRVVVK